MTATKEPVAAHGSYGDGVGKFENSGSDRFDLEGPDMSVQCPAHTTERKLMSKIDWHILPFIIVLYLLAFLDRVNIANARSFNMEKDLGMDVGGTQYNSALVIFFPPYILAEIPSNIFLKRFSPKVWLPACMLGFGIITTCQGLVQNFAGLLVTRFLLGVFEAGLFPGCFYLLSMWYKRAEAQKRYSLFFASTSLAGAFGGLLASAIGKMDGIRGYHGWRWIFILEGLLTCVVAFIFYPYFPEFPEQAKFLKEDEREYVKLRLQADTGKNGAERKTSFRDFFTVMKDYRIYLGGFMYFGLIVPAYGYAYFAPAIISTYNYDPIQTQLHSVPPWAASFGFSLVIAALSDKFRHRAFFALAPLSLAISGFAILLTIHNNTPVQYMALCFVTMGCYGAMPIIICWFAMNLGGHHRRAIGTAWQVGFGNIGGIIATFAFLAKDKPFYIPGYSICIAFTILSGISSVLYLLSIMRDNRRRAKTVTNVGLTEYEKSELGDLSPDFRYMY